jgi:tRNA U55 pseudouridine synthase TruB
MVFLAIMIAVNIFIKNKMKDLVRTENEIFKQNNRLTIKAIMEFLLIKIFNKEQHEIQLSEKIVKDLPTLRAKIAKYQILFYVLLFFFIKSLEIGIYGFLGYLVWK